MTGVPKEKLVDLNITRDGFVKISELESILNSAFADLVKGVEIITDAFSHELQKLRDENRSLRRELETERRLRLGTRGRK